jgi:hypothetical protein
MAQDSSDKGQGARGKVQGTRSKGQGARFKVQGARGKVRRVSYTTLVKYLNSLTIRNIKIACGSPK